MAIDNYIILEVPMRTIQMTLDDELVEAIGICFSLNI